MFLLIFLLVIFVLTVISLIIFLFSVLQIVVWKIKNVSLNRVFVRLKKSAVIFIVLSMGIIGVVMFSQFTAHTPKILDQNGKVLKGSIAELRKVQLNGRYEWISVRGKNKNNPVLLFLAGGPGGTQMAATRYELSRLEDNFVVVSWDQPGSGKSYNAISSSKITVDTYTKDGIALTDFLRKSFKTDKIYLMGESWGSALGIFLAAEAPSKYYAFIGTGQMVDFKETEIIDYKKVIELASKSGDKRTVKKLKENGMPPYYGSGVTWKSAVYLNYLSDYMTKDKEITSSGYHTLRDMFASEYGFMDSINYLRGVVTTFNHVYQQLYSTDLRKSFTKLKVPTYFFIGKHDVNAPISLLQEYYSSLEAPKKEIVWFEHSGHDPWRNESQFFAEQTVKVFLEK